MRKDAVIVGRHTWESEVEKWSRPWEFDEWKEVVCRGKIVNADLLVKYYAAQWEPESCHGYAVANKLFLKLSPKTKKIPVSRVVTLDDAEINRRFAVCLWRECGKLLTRRLTPSARQLVSDMHERMRLQAGIRYASEIEEGG